MMIKKCYNDGQGRLWVYHLGLYSGYEGVLLKRIVLNRWFGIVDLLCVLTSIILWETKLIIIWLPLCLALLPWLFRLLAGICPFQRTPIDGFMGVFMITAGIGGWTAYNQTDAWSKFWLIVGGILLFYAIAGQPHENQWLLTWFLGLIGVGVSGYFLLTQNWQINPAKIGLVNQIGLWWMKVRPIINIGKIDHDNAAGIIALSLPFFIMIWIRALREKRFFSIIGAIICSLVIFTGYIMATSRSASIALFFGIMIGVGWYCFVSFKVNISRRLQKAIVPIFLFLLIITAGIFILELDNSIYRLDNSGTFADASARPILISSTIKLIRDFILTGSGLNSFPGLYSHYILGIPFVYIQNSRNLFLDIGLEQGLLGLLAFCGIYVWVLWSVLYRNLDATEKLITGAVITSLSILLLHNLIENTLYGPGEAPLIFVLPGMAYLIIKQTEKGISTNDGYKELNENKKRNPVIIGAGIALIIIFGLLFVYRRSLIADWYADLGSIQMAKIELAGFPAVQSDSGKESGELTLVEEDFVIALQNDPENQTANYRLGLISMMKRDYYTAMIYLNKAYSGDQGNRGVIKMLGYSYVWSGELGKAEPMLRQISESKQEMETYSWWWDSQGRSDLALFAKAMVKQLE